MEKKILNIVVPVEAINKEGMKIGSIIDKVIKDLANEGFPSQYSPLVNADVVLLASNQIELEEMIKLDVLKAAKLGIPIYSLFPVNDSYVSPHVTKVIPIENLPNALRGLYELHAKERSSFREHFVRVQE